MTLTPKRRLRPDAFTLPEVLVTLAVSVLISVAVVASQLYGIRMTELTQTRIHSNDKARQWIRLLSSDINSSQVVRIGTGSATSFTEASNNSPQEGNALQLHPSGNPHVYIRYFRSTDDSKLKRMAIDGSIADIASGISNPLVFSMEDVRGNVLTDRQNNSVIAIDLQFSHLENPDLPVGPEHHYKSYRFRTRIAHPKIL